MGHSRLESPSHADAQWHDDSPDSLTVAGAAPELPLEWAHRLPVSPAGRAAGGLLNAGSSLLAIGATVNAEL